MALTPIIKSEDPYFNHEAAQKAAELVMKMDEDEARIFTTMVVGDLLEEDITKNLRTLQRHLDRVVSKRIERVKQALLNSTVSKGAADKETLAYAQALSLIEKAGQRNPYEWGYQFDESDFRRDRGGRFATKVRPRTDGAPLSRKQAISSGIAIGEEGSEQRKKYDGLDTRKQAMFQSEYRQVADFLGGVYNSVDQPGETDVMLHVQNEHTGERHVVRPRLGTKVTIDDWDPSYERVVGVEARPTGLTVGGAAFGLANSLGANAHTADKIGRGVGRVDGALPDFANDWTAPTSDNLKFSTNARLYQRTEAAGKFLTTVAPKGSHAHIAGKFGEFIGSRGPEAEKVLGPAARKTAYRYRGTEKTPDRELIHGFEVAVRSENRPSTEMTPEIQRGVRTARTRAVNAEIRRRATEQNKPEGAIRIPDEEAKEIRNQAARAYLESKGFGTPEGAPPRTWDEGRRIVTEHLMAEERRPKAGLYDLQLEAGVTPPSEGVIIDREGSLRVQASGYGDDHYLPFDLKSLKSLKGGEYIRTRSVGGPTTEDIYTGLVMGARRVTVASRSGTFTVIFEDDFRGGRRHNDKARRMVGRYAKLLDAVQSEQVERAKDVRTEVRDAITHQVRQDFPRFTRAEQTAEIERRIKEYKSDPQMSAEDELAFEAEYDRQSEGMSDNEKQRLRSKMVNAWKADKEYVFRLNGLGYADALNALQEQFPYYIKTHYVEPGFEPERFAGAKDKGYVEPGRNRPTKAREGFHGTVKEQSGKYSAAMADFQGYRGKLTPVKAPTKPEEKPAEPIKTAAGVAVPTGEKREVTVTTPAAAEEFSSAATGLFRHINSSKVNWVGDEFGFLRISEEEFAEQMKDPEKAAAFDRFWNQYKDDLAKQGVTVPTEVISTYNRAASRTGRKKYDPQAGLIIPAGKPFLFDQPAYQEGADVSLVNHEVEMLDRTPSVSKEKKLSEMTDDELNHELDTLAKVRAGFRYSAGRPLAEVKEELEGLGVDTKVPGVAAMLSTPEKVDSHIETVHRMRALNLNREAPQKGDIQVSVVTAQPLEHGRSEADNRAELESRVDTFRQAARLLTGPDEFRAAVHLERMADDLEENYLQKPTLSHDEYQVANEMTEKMYGTAKDIVNRKAIGGSTGS